MAKTGDYYLAVDIRSRSVSCGAGSACPARLGLADVTELLGQG
jgi:hypothetical protein